jgi:hypothetical protein
MPWPLGACLATASNQYEIREIADRVEAGEFGDIADWKAAEKRWADHGVTVEDIDYPTDYHWPFDKNVTCHGFPFAASGYSVTMSLAMTLNVSRMLSAAQRLLDIHAQQSGSHIRLWISDCTLLVLSVLAEVDEDSAIP